MPEILSYFTLSLLLGCIVSLGSGLFVFLNDRKNKANIAWLFLNASSAVWSLGYFEMITATSKNAAWIANWSLHYAAILIPIFFLLFILHLTKTYQQNKLVVYFSLVFALLMIAINHTTLFVQNVFPKFTFNYAPDAGPAYIYFTVYFFIVVLFSIFVLLKKMVSEKNESEKLRLRYILISSVLGFAGGGSVFFITFNINFPPYLLAAFSFYPIIISYSIVKHKLFDVRAASSVILVFVLLIFSFFRLFLSTNLSDLIANSVLFILNILIGVSLVNKMGLEISHREETEKLALDLERSNTELEVANERLKELDKQKTEFVSIASHQLRSPLTAIKGYSSMLLEGSFGKLSDKSREAVQVVFESSQKLVGVIEDFLNITRIELGKMKYEMSIIDMGKMVESVVNELKPNVMRRGLTMTFTGDEGPYNINGDSGKLNQVFLNVIDNAIKYTEKGSIAVKIERRQEGGKKLIRFSSQDTGVGMDQATLPKLFEKFVRADGVGQINITGTGLGLYVAKQIVEAHGGKIWAESKGKGLGSTFIMEMAETKPLAEQKKEAEVKTFAGEL